MEKATSLKVEKVGKPITVQLEKLSFRIAEKDKPSFLRDPGRFLSRLLKKNGYTVNAMHIVSSEVERLKKSVKRKGAARGTTWHCIAPAKFKCRRIIVINK